MTSVINHWNTYGPRGVPRGLVYVQNCTQGRTPCLKIVLAFILGVGKKIFSAYLPVSRRSREVLIMTAIKLPKALMQIRTFNARDAPLPLPNNFWKNRAAAICFELRISSRDAAEKYATLTRMYSTVTRIRENGALQRRVLMGFYSLLSIIKYYLNGIQT